MRYDMGEERARLFWPGSGSALIATVKGSVSLPELKNAAEKAVRANGALGRKAFLDENGRGFFEELPSPAIPVSFEEASPGEVLAREEKRRFAVEDGELARIFILTLGGRPKIMIYAHSFAGDGNDLALLLRDIMAALSGEVLRFRPVPRREILTGKPCLPRRLAAKALNRSWRRKKLSFHWEDNRELFDGYWEDRQTKAFFHAIGGEDCERLTASVRIRGVFLAAAFAGALFQAAGDQEDLRLCLPQEKAADGWEPPPCILPSSCWEAGEDFWENARRLQQRLQKSRPDAGKAFAAALEPSLLDAAYFYAFGQREDFEAGAVVGLANLFPKGETRLYCLTGISIPCRYGEWGLGDLFFLPPFSPGEDRALGLALLGGTVTFSLRAAEGPGLMASRSLFERAAGLLREI